MAKRKKRGKILKRRVHKSNRTSGKITVPVAWIKRRVIVILDG